MTSEKSKNKSRLAAARGVLRSAALYPAWLALRRLAGLAEDALHYLFYAAVLALAYLVAGYAAAQAGYSLPGHAQLVDFVSAIAGRVAAGRGG